MKLIFSIITLAIFSNINAQKDCDAYARKAVEAEFMEYGFSSQQEVDEAKEFYYNSCTEAGGNIDDPVFM